MPLASEILYHEFWLLLTCTPSGMTITALIGVQHDIVCACRAIDGDNCPLLSVLDSKSNWAVWQAPWRWHAHFIRAISWYNT